MIVRRLAARRLVKSGSTAEEPRRRRATRFLLTIVAAGLLSGVAAWVGIGPFGSVQALIKNASGTNDQLPAQDVFPPVQAIHQTLDVYDPPPAQPTEPPDEDSAEGSDD